MAILRKLGPTVVVKNYISTSSDSGYGGSIFCRPRYSCCQPVTTSCCSGGGSFWSGFGQGIGLGISNLFSGMFGGGMFGGGMFGGGMFGGGMFGGGMFGGGMFGGGMFNGGIFGNNGIFGGGYNPWARTNNNAQNTNNSSNTSSENKDNPKFKDLTGKLSTLLDKIDKNKPVTQKDIDALKKEIKDAKAAEDGVQSSDDKGTYDNLLISIGTLHPNSTDGKTVTTAKKPAETTGDVGSTTGSKEPGINAANSFADLKNAIPNDYNELTDAEKKAFAAKLNQLIEAEKNKSTKDRNSSEKAHLIKLPNLSEDLRTKLKQSCYETDYSNYDGTSAVDATKVKRAHDVSENTRDTVNINGKKAIVTQTEGQKPTEITLQDNKSIKYTFVETKDSEQIYKSNNGQLYILQKSSNGEYHLMQYCYHDGFGTADWK